VSHVFDSGPAGGEPYQATVRLLGRRLGVVGMAKPRDSFVHEETVSEVVPGTGPVTVSSSIHGVKAGEWSVTAELFRGLPGGSPPDRRRVAAEPLQRAAWSWRGWRASARPEAPVRTRDELTSTLARIPAVQPGSYQVMAVAAFVGGVLIALAGMSTENIALAPALGVIVAALVAGVAGAKLWYAVLHPAPWRQRLFGGWAVDGFLVVMVLAGLPLLFLSGLPVGRVMDAGAPGLFAGVAIGRIGCFLTGCCAGRCTASGWGIWSSDRRIGARRLPTQLYESAAGLAIALVSGVIVFGFHPAPEGAVFVVAWVAYLGLRQMLLRLRAERREFSWLRHRDTAGSA